MGEPIGKGLIIERGIKAAAELTQEYGLHQEEGKRLDRTHREALHEPDAKRYRIYEAIQEVLPRCRGMDDLEKELLMRGIATRYRFDRDTGERQGVSFRLENRSFKGGRVDNKCTLSGLERTLKLQEQLRQEEVERERLRQEELRKEELRQEVLRLQEELRQDHGLRRGMRHRI